MKNLLPLVTLALTGLVAADSFQVEYSVEHPASVDGFEYCQNTHCDRDLWKTLPATRGTALCGITNVNQIGYRRAGDDSTSVIYKCDDSVQPLIFTREGSPDLIGAKWSVSVSQEWPTAPAKRDFSQVQLGTSGTFSVIHTECPDGNKLTLTTVDANGVTETVEGVDELSKPMPDAFPINATIIVTGSNGFNATGEFTVTGDNQILAQFGGDNGPTLSTNYNVQVEICPD